MRWWGGECLIVVGNGRVSSRSAPMRNFRTSHTNLRSACNANNNIIKKGEVGEEQKEGEEGGEIVLSEERSRSRSRRRSRTRMLTINQQS